MKPSTFPRILCAVLFLIVVAWAPQSLLAQRGGHGGGGFHGGGGGFHGGGGGFHGGGGSFYRGGGGSWGGGGGSWGARGGSWGARGGSWGVRGSSWGARGSSWAWRGSSWGWRGGGWGWGGGFWGFPSFAFGWGPGWGWGFGFGWGPVWPSAVWVPSPNFVILADSQSTNPTAYSPGSNDVYDNLPAQQSSPPPHLSVPDPNSVTIKNAAYSPTAPHYRTVAAGGNSGNYRAASSTAHQQLPLRPEVQNVIRALRAMPPDARQRQIDSGRYGNLTPQELAFVRYAADLPLVSQ